MTAKPKTEAELCETFTQFAQKCTICTQWLIGDDEIVTDPSHPWQMVHKDCIYLTDNNSNENPSVCISDIDSDIDSDKDQNTSKKIGS
jgi:hypothetical protein